MSDVTPRLSAALAGRYRIERELGAGGMATIYLAQDIRSQGGCEGPPPELAAVIGAERFLSDALYFTDQEFYTPYDVGPDGRFIMARDLTPRATVEAPLIVVQDWLDELKAKTRR